MNSSKARLPTLSPFSADIVRLNEATCGFLCQHPSCWKSLRRQENSIQRTLPLSETGTDSSEDEISLPLQSICNLLDDVGDNISSPFTPHSRRYFSQTLDAGSSESSNVIYSQNSKYNLKSPTGKRNTKRRLISNRDHSEVKKSGLQVLGAQDIFSKGDSSKGYNGLKKFYVWVPNPKKIQERLRRSSLESVKPHPMLVKDMTESMVPQDVQQKRLDNMPFSEWPTLKVKHVRLRTPRAKLAFNTRIEHGPGMTLAPVVTNNKGNFTSEGNGGTVVDKFTHRDEHMLKDKKTFTNRQMQHLHDHKGQLCHDGFSKSTTERQSEEIHVSEHPLLISTSVTEMRKNSDILASESFQDVGSTLLKYTGLCKEREQALPSHRLQHYSRITSVSLGLPELPAGVRRTRPFCYREQDWNLSLGPVIFPLSSSHSHTDEADSKYNTSVKSHDLSASQKHTSSEMQDQGGEKADNPVAPALLTDVPITSATTPQKPLQSCPPPEHWPLTTELSFDIVFPSSISEPAAGTRCDKHQARTGAKDKFGKTDQKDVTKVVDGELKIEAPAPPPPSPEPPAGPGRNQVARNPKS